MEYTTLIEGQVRKEVDFVSFRLHEDTFEMPDRVRKVARHAGTRGRLRVYSFPSRQALIEAAPSIRDAYNRAFAGNWEYYPLSLREVDLLVEQLASLVDPRFVKFISNGDRMVGFLFSFPDVTGALRKARGRLTPWSIVRLLLDLRRTDLVAINGAGILPEYQNRGGNALLYKPRSESTIRNSRFRTGDARCGGRDGRARCAASTLGELEPPSAKDSTRIYSPRHLTTACRPGAVAARDASSARSARSTRVRPDSS